MAREVIVFNKKGDKVARLELPQLQYLQTEKEWIQKRLDRSPEMDGVVLIIDWVTQQITIIRNAQID